VCRGWQSTSTAWEHGRFDDHRLRATPKEPVRRRSVKSPVACRPRVHGQRDRQCWRWLDERAVGFVRGETFLAKRPDNQGNAGLFSFVTGGRRAPLDVELGKGPGRASSEDAPQRPPPGSRPPRRRGCAPPPVSRIDGDARPAPIENAPVEGRHEKREKAFTHRNRSSTLTVVMQSQTAVTKDDAPGWSHPWRVVSSPDALVSRLWPRRSPACCPRGFAHVSNRSRSS
jgi:hypothetical protein